MQRAEKEGDVLDEDNDEMVLDKEEAHKTT